MDSTSQASLLLQKRAQRHSFYSIFALSLDLCKNPVDGTCVGLVDESNIFEWSVLIIGPPDTLYEGGLFNAIMTFPQNYPSSPPTVRFTSDMWHPNIYPDGRVCISILHPPGDNPNGSELASERWTPVHTVCHNGLFSFRVIYVPFMNNGVESIVFSIISMLSSPNDESPANVEAALKVMDCMVISVSCLCFAELVQDPDTVNSNKDARIQRLQVEMKSQHGSEERPDNPSSQSVTILHTKSITCTEKLICEGIG
ncbi:Ubiquitin-conjugating enzyme E2 [Dillenia turbinata]|uniref:Ubiquitin-conjugating enzyme E2 n=1 Tax=Dillenia turbinata TaxID=194707 RepID=A0AAN8ZAY8_9MAGN